MNGHITYLVMRSAFKKFRKCLIYIYVYSVLDPIQDSSQDNVGFMPQVLMVSHNTERGNSALGMKHHHGIQTQSPSVPFFGGGSSLIESQLCTMRDWEEGKPVWTF